MADWIERLHQNIKIECGLGWLVTPQGRKTKVWRRPAKGLGANNPRSCCNLDIPFKQENAPLIRDTVKRLNDLTRNADRELEAACPNGRDAIRKALVLILYESRITPSQSKTIDLYL